MIRIRRFKISPGFLLLAAWLYFLDMGNLVPMVLLSAFLHELGHYVVIRLFGIHIKQISLSVVGADMNLSDTVTYGQEILAAVAGPLINLILAWGVILFHLDASFLAVNLMLGLFNLLPILPLDGGRILHALVSWTFGLKAADFILKVSGFFSLAVMAVAGIIQYLLGGSGTLLLVAFWLGIGFFLGKEGIRACLNHQKQVK